MSGADSLAVTPGGDLGIRTGDAVVVQSAPRAYQLVAGREETRRSRVRERGRREITFEVEGRIRGRSS